jgi:hypothetical protein
MNWKEDGPLDFGFAAVRYANGVVNSERCCWVAVGLEQRVGEGHAWLLLQLLLFGDLNPFGVEQIGQQVGSTP